MASPYIQAPGTSGQKPFPNPVIPQTGKFSVNAMSQANSSTGLLTKNPAAPKPVLSQGTPSMAQVNTGILNTPFNAPGATQPLGQKANSATDGLKKPDTTLQTQFKAKTTGTQAGDLAAGNISSAGLNGAQSTTQGGTNATLDPNAGLTQLQQQAQQQNQQYAQNAQANPSNTTTGSAQDTSYGGLIGQLANRGQSDSDEVKKAREALTASQLEESQVLNANRGVDMNSGMAQDARERALFGNEQNALSQQLGNAVTTQGQQIGALQGAAGLAQPTNFGLIMDPRTGQPINSTALQGSLQSALALYNSGTPLDDPRYNQALSLLGNAGWPMLLSQIQQQNGGQFNPAAQSATQNQAITQGVGSQGAAYQLDTGLLNLKSLQPVITNFMAQSNINSTDSPLYNAQIGTYLSQVGNPGQYNQFQNMMGELRKFQSQLLASGAGGIPTDVSNTINSTDISKLSLKDIRTAMETMDVLGNLQKGNAQYQAQQSLHGSNVGYSGSPATHPTSVTPATPSTALGGQVQNPAVQGTIGAGLNFGPELAKWGAGIWTALKSFGL